MDGTIMVTQFSKFHRAKSGEEVRYYPADSASNRNAALEFDPQMVTVAGYAVYDTAITTEYAVGLYGNKTEAEAHAPVAVQQAPISVFEGDEPSSPKPGEQGTKPVSKKHASHKSKISRGR